MQHPSQGAGTRVWQAAHGHRHYTSCAKCGSGFEYARSYAYCNPCKAAYMRDWRKTHKLQGEARRKAICRSYSKVLIRRGKIRRQPCEVLGCTNKPQVHHDDYTNPRNVRWLCKEHHHDLHDAERRFICQAAA